MVRSWCLLLSISFVGCQSLSDQRQVGPQFMQAGTEPRAVRLSPHAGSERLLQALALVESDKSCSGVLIGKAATPESPAYLLTAGHCLMDFDDDGGASNRIFLDALPRSDSNLIRFQRTEFRIGRVVYASMKSLDLAVVEITDEESHASLLHLTERSELDADEARAPRPLTLARLKALGMEPLHWAKRLPDVGHAIRIVSVATDESGAALRLEHRCIHEGLTDVVESIWHWHGLARNNCEDVAPETSGAPVLDAESALFAIINTSSRHALSQDCYLGQPCELTEEGFQVASSRNYGTVVLDLPACFNAKGFFSPNEKHCSLPKPDGVRVRGQAKTPLNPQNLEAEKRRWAVNVQALEARSQGFRFKSGRLPGLQCDQRSGYSGALPWSDGSMRELSLPAEAGLYALCVISEENFQDGVLQKAVSFIVNVDSEAPQITPRLLQEPGTQEPLLAVRRSCRDLPAGASLEERRRCAVAVLTFDLQPYEFVDFYFTLIPAKAQDCPSTQAAGRGGQVHIPAELLPAKLCVWAVDGAGNRAREPAVFPIRAVTRRELWEATEGVTD